jgi:CheY-like chemotaxis protein
MSSIVTILVVDDNKANLKLASDILELEGFLVYRADAAQSALTLLETIKPQLILMDIGLPGMNGLELTRLLKSRPDTADVVIVALTAYATKSDKEKVVDAGCDGFITKPIDTRKLRGQVERFLKSGI